MLELVKAGGWPMIPLLLLGVLALAIVVERFWSLRRKEILPPGLGEEVRAWAARGQLEPAHIESLRRNSPLGEVLAAAYLEAGAQVHVCDVSEPALAEASFNRAIQLNPRDADAMHNLGWMWCQQGRLAPSLEQFARALAVPGYLDELGRDYPALKVIKLEQNYRSTQTIVNAANSIISKNKKQIHKTVFSEKFDVKYVEREQGWVALDSTKIRDFPY